MGRQLKFGEVDYLREFFNIMSGYCAGTELYLIWDNANCLFLRDKCGEGDNTFVMYPESFDLYPDKDDKVKAAIDELISIDWIGRSMSEFLPENGELNG